MMTLTDSEQIQATEPVTNILKSEKTNKLDSYLGCVLYANISCHNSVCFRSCVLCANVTTGVRCCCRGFAVGAQGLCALCER